MLGNVSWNAKDSCSLFIVSLVTFYAVQTESATNQNRSMSSSPTPLKVGSFICVAISLSRDDVIGEFLPLRALGGDVAGSLTRL